MRNVIIYVMFFTLWVPICAAPEGGQVGSRQQFMSQLYCKSREVTRRLNAKSVACENVLYKADKPEALKKLVNKNPEAVVDVASHHIERFSQEALSVIIEACHTHNVKIYPLLKAIRQQIEHIDLLTLNMCVQDVQAAEILAPYVADRIEESRMVGVARRILRVSPASVQHFIAPICDNIVHVPYEVVDAVVRAQPHTAVMFADAIIERDCIAHISARKFEAIISTTAAYRKLHVYCKSLCEQLYNQNSLAQLILMYPHICTAFPDIVERYAYQIPSIQHILEYGCLDDAVVMLESEVACKPCVMHALQQCVQQEQVERGAGRYTFVHGQKWAWHFYAHLFKRLWNIRFSDAVSGYEFVRFYAPCTKGQEGEQHAMRQRIMHEGKTEENRSRLLFLNGPLFGNMQDSGCSSAFYCLRNHDMSNPDMDICSLFYELGFPDEIYDRYANELHQLQYEHTQLTAHGNILLFSLSKEQIARMVYLAAPYGHKKTVSVDGVPTDDVCTVLDALADDPSRIADADRNEFCLVLTGESGGALDPHSGMRVFSFHATDQSAFAAWEKKLDDLCARIYNAYNVLLNA